MAKKKDNKNAYHTGQVARNRKAYHDYAIEEEVEAGLQLQGSEVKSLREGRANINDGYAGEKDGELYIFNINIGEYSPAERFGHEPTRPRKLLVHKKQQNQMLGKAQQKGYTLVPLSLYFNDRGLAKLKIGLARGKKEFEKRDTIKDREWQRRKADLLRE